MYKALGYEYEEISEKYEMGILVEKKVTKKQVVPDTTAQIFWLKNRKPDAAQIDGHWGLACDVAQKEAEKRQFFFSVKSI